MENLENLRNERKNVVSKLEAIGVTRDTKDPTGEKSKEWEKATEKLHEINEKLQKKEKE